MYYDDKSQHQRQDITQQKYPLNAKAWFTYRITIRLQPFIFLKQIVPNIRYAQIADDTKPCYA